MNEHMLDHGLLAGALGDGGLSVAGVEGLDHVPVARELREEF